MASTTTPQEAMRRVEGELRRWEQLRQSQQRVLQLLTAIAVTLETTKHDSHEKTAVAALSEVVTPNIVGRCSSPPPDFSSSTSLDGVGAAPALGRPIQAALGGVLLTLGRSQRAVSDACSRFSWRMRAIDESVRCLCNAVTDGAALVRKRLDAQRCERALDALLLAALATMVRSGCDATQDTAEDFKTEPPRAQEEESVDSPLPVSAPLLHSNALRRYWHNEEQALTAAVSDIAAAHHSAAYTTCKLLRSSLLETLSAQRRFPSPGASRARRLARSAWYRELNEATARRRAVQKAKWERHERVAGALSELEWTTPSAEDTNGKAD
ncbi:uncharacterized protein Tco025E_00841 [Trypanosoma conorhini]|uniref:Uncharacterized protein n=1 Tax=Trypanosoma conorhini TaxID=83891 RepID=A0A422QAA4_9TRYP|nr:uncharacterized protein Tco025E_00841 [Trypanosoma conorhini]RNF26879.1 hypothetical protein Tco025E_00841 [Trypanosoma conorhini]